MKTILIALLFAVMTSAAMAASAWTDEGGASADNNGKVCSWSCNNGHCAGTCAGGEDE